MSWACRWLEPSDEALHGLRRHADGPCPGMDSKYSYHSATTWLGRVPEPYDEAKGAIVAYEPTTPRDRRAEPRWPSSCKRCSYRFRKRDSWQDFMLTIWRREDDGAEFTDATRHLGAPIPPMPVGSMFDSWWLDGPEHVGPDGLSVSVLCPNGQVWHVDLPSSSGGRWTRSGTPPALVVMPSIKIGLAPTLYHGWLGCNGAPPGILTDPLPDSDLTGVRDTAGVTSAS